MNKYLEKIAASHRVARRIANYGKEKEDTIMDLVMGTKDNIDKAQSYHETYSDLNRKIKKHRRNRK